MTKLIALRSGFNDGLFHAWRSTFTSQLKQQALLFDQIGIFKLTEMYENLATFKKYPDYTENAFDNLITELKWLEKNNIIFDATFPTITDIETFVRSNEFQKVDEVAELFTRLRKIRKVKVKSLEDAADEIESINKQHAIVLRLMSVVMETTKKVNTVTTLPYKAYSRKLPSSNKSDVAQIVINSLPLPNNETPWEQIIDYRKDSETQKLLSLLRRWISKTSKQNLPPFEIEEEIESLINDFQEHMKLHKMKANTETVEVITKAPLEFLEFKFSKIIDPLFAIKKRKINLLEAEMNAPGREISYIIKTQEAFLPDE